MKPITYLIAIILIPSFSFAGNIDLTLRQDIYTDTSLETGYTLRATYAKDDDGLFLAASMSDTAFLSAGQVLAGIQYFSLDIGMRWKIKQGRKLTLKPYIQVGYYHPISSSKGSTEEAHQFYMASKLTGLDFNHYAKTPACDNPYAWNDRSYKIQGAPGGELGIDAEWKFTSSIGLYIHAAYRILSFRHTVTWKSQEYISRHPGSWWEVPENVNMSGPSIGVGVRWEF